ncbi:MAG: radical SAM protein [Bacteroidales bacterium]|jgi:uncharacterized protein|nr:radical SAM protein [Bacteroidales bacterium]
MKFSQFNSLIEYREQYVLFNSYHNKVILLDPNLHLLLKSSTDVDDIENLHPSLFYYLIRHKFIIDNSVNEVEDIIDLRTSIDENTKEFILFINPTMNCNFNCWYCYEKKIKNSKIDPFTLIKIEKYLNNLFNENPSLKSFSLSFFGGEPLLFFKKNVVPLIDNFIFNCNSFGVLHNINFTTNGFLVNDFLIDYFLKNNIFPSFQITLDGFKNDHNITRYNKTVKDSYSKIIENIKNLIKNHFLVRVRINYTEKNISNLCKIANDFNNLSPDVKDKYLVFDFQRVWQNEDGLNIDEILHKTILQFKEEGFNVNHKNNMNNLIDPCYADKRNSLIINYNGDIYKCTARDFNPANREGFIDENGYIIWINEFLEKRMHIKFKNKTCFSCKIFPICIGGCSQQALENNGNDYCIYFKDETKIMNVVRYKIENLLYNKDVKIPTLNENSS